MKFLKISCKRERLGMFYNKDLENRKHNQSHKTGILKHARTAENVTTEDELVDPLMQESQKQTHHSKCQISKGTDLTQCSMVQIIHSVFCLKCFSFTNMIADYYCWFFVHSHFTRQCSNAVMVRWDI